MALHRSPTRVKQRQKTSRQRQKLRSARRSNQQEIDSSLVQRAMVSPHTLRPTDILRLQATVGNRAVQQMLADESLYVPPRNGDHTTVGQPPSGQNKSVCPTIQRVLMMADELKQSGGSLSKKAKLGRSTYRKILSDLSNYPKQKKYNNKLKILLALWQNGMKWLTEHNQRLENNTQEIKRTKRQDALLKLLESVSTEMAALTQNPPQTKGTQKILDQPIFKMMAKSEDIYQELQTDFDSLQNRANQLNQSSDNSELQAVGQTLQYIQQRAFQLQILMYNPERPGSYYDQLEEGFQANLQGGDPKMVYDYAYLDQSYKEKTAEECKVAMAIRLDNILQLEGMKQDVWFHTEKGKRFRETQSILLQPESKAIYDAFLEGPKAVAEFMGLLAYKDRIQQLFMNINQIRLKLANIEDYKRKNK